MKTRAPAVEGWFTMDDSPQLLGARCGSCGTVYFPPGAPFCRNPQCGASELEETTLSRRGTVWSFTDARYQPPPPYVAADPFEPFALAAVELADEQMVVLGQVAGGVGVDGLRVGMEMELTLETLFEDDEHDYVVWRWKPVD